jgi:hypothetical protein
MLRLAIGHEPIVVDYISGCDASKEVSGHDPCPGVKIPVPY